MCIYIYIMFFLYYIKTISPGIDGSSLVSNAACAGEIGVQTKSDTFPTHSPIRFTASTSCPPSNSALELLQSYHI